MKRAILLALTMGAILSVEAQSNEALMRKGFVRDSLAEVLAEHRMNYAKNPSMRERLTPVILSLEQELLNLQGDYERAVEEASQRDINQQLADYAKAQTEVAEPKVESAPQPATSDEYRPDPLRMRRDLVANDYFTERLSEDDAKTLRASKQREVKAKEAVAQYVKLYGELLALQRRYMEVPTRSEADVLAREFAQKEGEMVRQDELIRTMSGSLFYNKMYAYDLLMERGGKTSMLDLSANLSARAEREIEDNRDLYQSNALVDYYTRKKAMVEYEIELSSMLSLTPSRDSLRVVATELKHCDYRFSKLSLERRSFIDYEDIKVKTPTVYNSSNHVPRTKVYDYGTIYRIRIGIFSKRPNISALRGVMPLSYTDEYNNGMYAYYVGGFRTEQEAKEGAAYLKKLGFKEPIIAVWIDGEYYPTLEEMRRVQSQYNIEISGVPTLTEDMKAKILSHKADCTISRIGSTFVVGTFEGKSVAEAVAADLQSLDGNIAVKLSKLSVTN